MSAPPEVIIALAAVPMLAESLSRPGVTELERDRLHRRVERAVGAAVAALLEAGS